MKRDELAEKLGVSYGTIAALEQGSVEPKASHLLKLSSIFNVSIDYLLENEKEIKIIYEKRTRN